MLQVQNISKQSLIRIVLKKSYSEFEFQLQDSPIRSLVSLNLNIVLDVITFCLYLKTRKFAACFGNLLKFYEICLKFHQKHPDFETKLSSLPFTRRTVSQKRHYVELDDNLPAMMLRTWFDTPSYFT